MTAAELRAEAVATLRDIMKVGRAPERIMAAREMLELAGRLEQAEWEHDFATNKGVK